MQRLASKFFLSDSLTLESGWRYEKVVLGSGVGMMGVVEGGAVWGHHLLEAPSRILAPTITRLVVRVLRYYRIPIDIPLQISFQGHIIDHDPSCLEASTCFNRIRCSSYLDRSITRGIHIKHSAS